MKKLIILFRLIGVYKNISKFNNTSSSYHKKAKTIIDRLLADIEIDSIDQFPQNGKLKMQWYMAEFIYTCEVYNRLLGQKSTSKQRESYLLSGALIAMCDMIIDDIKMDDARIDMLKSPDPSIEGSDEVEQIYSTCYHAFFNSLPEHLKERTKRYYDLLFDAQVRSKKQFDPTLNKNEVDAICKDKCGYSMLFLRAIVEGEIDVAETKAWYETGGFIQFCNDAQDLHKDLNKNMVTFASVRSNLSEVADAIDRQRSKAFSLLKKTSYPQKRKDNLLLTLYVMHLGIMAKLHQFYRVCNYGFSQEKFKSISKEKLRAITSNWHLIRFVLPRVLNYNYNNVEKSDDYNKAISFISRQH